MGGVGSGGHNRKSVEALKLSGTYKPSRHGARASEGASEPVSRGDRRMVLAGLDPAAKRLAGRLLDEFGPWDGAALATLREYARSISRIEGLADGPERRAEVRNMIALLKSLHLDQEGA